MEMLYVARWAVLSGREGWERADRVTESVRKRNAAMTGQ